MSCGLSRAEIIRFNVSVNDQRCQAICKEGRICGDMITEHPPGYPVMDINARPKSSCCSVCVGRFLILVAFGIFTFLVVSSGLILGTSGTSLEVPSDSISNLLLEEENLVFGFRENNLYLYTYTIDDNEERTSSYSFVTELRDFDCQENNECKATLNDLMTTSECIVGSSIPSMVFSVLAFFMLLPRIGLLCLHNTRCYETSRMNNSVFYNWFVNPQLIIYIVSLFYGIVFTLCLTFVVIYVQADPHDEEFYKLAITYINSNPEICDPTNTCTFPLGEARSSHMFAFFVIAIVFSALACMSAIVLNLTKVPGSTCLCNDIEETEIPNLRSSAHTSMSGLGSVQNQQLHNDKYVSVQQHDVVATPMSLVSMVQVSEPDFGKNQV